MSAISGTTDSAALVHWPRVGVQTERLLSFSPQWTRRLAMCEHKACKPGVPHPAKRQRPSLCEKRASHSRRLLWDWTCNVDYLFNPFVKAIGKGRLCRLNKQCGAMKASSELEVEKAFLFAAVVSPSAPNLLCFSEKKKTRLLRKFECITKIML